VLSNRSPQIPNMMNMSPNILNPMLSAQPFGMPPAASLTDSNGAAAGARGDSSASIESPVNRTNEKDSHTPNETRSKSGEFLEQNLLLEDDELRALRIANEKEVRRESCFIFYILHVKC
jgi:hypothetical protein